jgi:hypothetical protein
VVLADETASQADPLLHYAHLIVLGIGLIFSGRLASLAFGAPVPLADMPRSPKYMTLRNHGIRIPSLRSVTLYGQPTKIASRARGFEEA